MDERGWNNSVYLFTIWIVLTLHGSKFNLELVSVDFWFWTLITFTYYLCKCFEFSLEQEDNKQNQEGSKGNEQK